MARIRIPPSAFTGFEAISNLDSTQVRYISEFLERTPVGTNLNLSELNDFLFNSLNIVEAKGIVDTLVSFSELLQPADVDFESLADKLASSYQEQGEQEVSELKKEKLKENLILIFKSSNNLKLTLKAIDLIGGDNYLFRDCKIITDINSSVVFLRVGYLE